MPKSARTKAYLSLFLNALIWGAALPIVKPALEFVTPYQYLFYRYLIAAVLSLPILIYILIKTKPSLKHLITIVALESIGVTLALSFLYEGLKRTSSIEATLLANTAPLFIVLGGIIFLKEKEELHELIGLILALTGMVVLTLEPLLDSTPSFSISLSGNVLILFQNIFWSAYVLLAKKYYKKTSKLLIGFISLWVGLFTFLPLSILFNPELLTISAHIAPFFNSNVLLATIYMGILGSIIAIPAYIYGNNLIEASEASLFTYLQPLITIPLATLWLNEPFTKTMLFALIITGIGVFVATNKKSLLLLKKNTSPNSS